MRFGFKFGFGGGEEFTLTNCYPSLTQLTDGGYGYDLAQVITGALTPDTTANGIPIYSASFYDNGDFFMSFGVAGTTQLFADIEETNEIKLIIKSFGTEHVELHWNTTNLRYEGINTTLATATALRVGTKVCFGDIVIPDKLIDIDFGILEVV